MKAVGTVVAGDLPCAWCGESLGEGQKVAVDTGHYGHLTCAGIVEGMDCGWCRQPLRIGEQVVPMPDAYLHERCHAMRESDRRRDWLIGAITVGFGVIGYLVVGDWRGAVVGSGLCAIAAGLLT